MFLRESKRALTLIVAASLCACSGGGSSAPRALATIVPVPASSPTAGATSPNTSARFTITVPKAKATTASGHTRTPKYISSATQSVIITLVSVSGTPYTGTPASIAANLTTSNPNCSGSPLTCSVSAPAVGGSDVFTITAYDAQQTSTSPTSPAGNALSTATTTIPVTAGQANTVTTPIVLGGIVSSVSVGLSPSSVTEGTPASNITVAINALDADGNIIMGSYVDANGDPLTVDLADSNTTDTPLSTTSVTNSSTAVTLSYDGTNISAPSITPSVTGGTFAGTASAATLMVDVPSAPGVTGLSQIEWVTSSSTTSFPETITGSNFTAVGTTVGISGPGLTVSNVTVESSTTITATVTLAANSATSSPTIIVTTPGGSAQTGLSIDPGFVVTSNGDTMPGSPAGTGPGVSGDLRYALSNVVSGDAIVFSCGTPCTIDLAGPLPPIELSAGNLVIDGGSQTVIDGGSTAGAGAGSRVFFVDTGTVFFNNLTIQNALAQGGAGNYGGGGGLGAGAGIFVNQSSATANVFNVSFVNVVAIGGAGSAIDNFDSVGGGGGGGLDAAGGANPRGAGSGGGGVLSQGGSTSYGDADAGGGGGGGLGGAEGGEVNGGAAGTAYGSNAAGTSGSNAAFQSDNSTNAGNGGNGGFGGGGGGGGTAQPGMNADGGVGGNGGTGGFGGGGGAGSACGNMAAAGSGGNGGPGGGGGAAYPGMECAGGGPFDNGSVAGNGGGLASLTGGNGALGNGGGGAAAGPAIFVNAGSLNTTGVTVSSFTITAGAGVAGKSIPFPTTSSPGTAGAAPVFNYAGRVNGSSTTGDITSAVTVSSTLRRTVAPTLQADRRRSNRL